MKKITRIGVGGPVGSGKTAIIEAITPIFVKMGVKVLIITNDIVTTEDAKHVQRTLERHLARRTDYRRGNRGLPAHSRARRSQHESCGGGRYGIPLSRQRFCAH